MKSAVMADQLLSDATSPIKYNGSQPEINTAGSTKFVLFCGCRLPADFVVDPDVPGKRHLVCREVNFHIFTLTLFCHAFLHVILIGQFWVRRRGHAIMTYG